VTIGFIILAATVGRFIVSTGMRLASKRSEIGPMVSFVVVAMIGGAAVSQALGLEAVLGVFAAGLLIGRSRNLRRQVTDAIGGVTHSVLAPVFFATVGLRVDLTAFAQPLVLGAGAAVLAVAIFGKFAGAYLGARASRMSHWESLALGAGMNARGAVEIVVASVGVHLGVLNPQMYTIIVAVAVITSLIAPPLLRATIGRVAATPEESQRLKANGPANAAAADAPLTPTNTDSSEMKAS
jgi:Kef-type K+ transport system membrane component KefB